MSKWIFPIILSVLIIASITKIIMIREIDSKIIILKEEWRCSDMDNNKCVEYRRIGDYERWMEEKFRETDRRAKEAKRRDEGVLGRVEGESF